MMRNSFLDDTAVASGKKKTWQVNIPYKSPINRALELGKSSNVHWFPSHIWLYTRTYSKFCCSWAVTPNIT
jgi:hypothetical protein